MITEEPFGMGTSQYGGVYFFNDLKNPTNVYQNSHLRDWCRDFSGENTDSVVTVLTSQELAGLMETEKDDAAYDVSTYGVKCSASANILQKDKVFSLSAEEAMTYFPTEQDRKVKYNGNNCQWWLRSATTGGSNRGKAATVHVVGGIGARTVFSDNTARPASNLSHSSVILTSPAVGGKVLGDLSEVSNITASADKKEWKLTLLDANRNAFSASLNAESKNTVCAGDEIKIDYAEAKSGRNEYVSVALCDEDDNILYYGNITSSSVSGIAAVNIPTGLAAGDYILNVFSEQCNGDKKTDYASAFQPIELSVINPKEETPKAIFTSASDAGGTLTDVTTAMKYSVDGGVNWHTIDGTTMYISGVTSAKGVKIYQPGNGVTTSDSDVQTITITQSTKPTGLVSESCTTSEQNDGKIIGVDTTMEYRLATDKNWQNVTGTELAGLTNATYAVRVKASGTVLASETENVVVGKHICVAFGEWENDGEKHWHKCECGAKLDEAMHSGGNATCINKAICEVCKIEYGAISVFNHSNLVKTEAKSATHMAEGNKEYYHCTGCNKYYGDVKGTQEITLESTVIPRKVEHVADNKGWHNDGKEHWNTCECGVELNRASHTFGDWIIDSEATEITKGSKHRTCSVCEYTETMEIPVVKPTPKPVIYKFLKGAGERYVHNKGESFMVKVNGELDKFQSVSVDGQVVDKKYYESKSGSTILTFTADYMNTLSAGNHTIVVKYTDGEAIASFTVKGTPSPKPSPITGDSSNVILILAVLFVSGGVLVISLIVRKRRNAKR